MQKNRYALSYLALLVGQICVPTAAWVVALPAQSAQTHSAEAPALMLPKVWQAGRSPVGFLVSEKLDGVRAFWDGTRLRFRSGLPMAAPDWFTAGLPKVALDGELWLGRGQFDRLSGMVRSAQPQDADWRELRYMVFDLPGAAGNFAKRASELQALVQAADKPWLQAVVQSRVESVAALQMQLKQLVATGGEGLVLHRADALWEAGRSDALWKFKPVQDEDARVVGHLPGKGRNAGRLGALLLEMPDGQRFALGSGFTDAQRESPPAVGTVVTYRWRDHTPKGLPRFASFLRVRGPE
jgi:DNA ligase-1